MAQVTDKLKRPLRDLRISVTDQCNFRCAYCMPKEIFGPDYAFLPKSQTLSNDEILFLVQSFEELGVEKIRLTGGEPLLRKDLVDLISKIRNQTSIADISLTTNASLLPRYAKPLKDAGLNRINISMDSLKAETLSEMNGRRLEASIILKGIDAAQEAGLHTKVNMVVKKGLNDDEILDMATAMRDRNVSLRFIEFMDVGNTNQWKLNEVVSAESIQSIIAQKYPFEPIAPNYVGEVASRFKYTDSNTEFGVINSVTKPFCTDCNRARVSADGKIFTCLFASQGVDIRSKIREGISQKEFTKFVSKIWSNRDDRYSELRQDPNFKDTSSKKVEMSYIGG